MGSKLTALVLIGLLCLVCVSVLADDFKLPQVEWHGYMQNRLYAGAGSSAEFRTERISLSASEALPQDSKAYVEVYYQPWGPVVDSDTYLESAYYDHPLGDGRIRVGKGRQLNFGITPAYPNRRTTNYGIVAELFTQDRIQGVQYYIKKGVLDSGITLFQGYRMGTRHIGDVAGDYAREGITGNTVPHLAFRDGEGTSMTSNVWATGRLGAKWTSAKAGISYMKGTIEASDLSLFTSTTATGTLNGGTTTALVTANPKKGVDVFALDASYQFKNSIFLQGESYNGKISNLGMNAWDLMIGHEPAGGWHEYLRYERIGVSGVPTANPLTWDLNQVSLSVVQPISKTVWMQYEYEINDENPQPGRAKVSNNLFLAEIFTGF